MVNPYSPPEVDPSVKLERRVYKELDMKELKRICNHSQTIRTIGILSVCVAILGVAIVFFSLWSRWYAVSVLGGGIGLLMFCGFVAYGSWRRPSWGRILGVLFCISSLFAIPVGTIVGVLGLIAYGRGSALFGGNRYERKILEDELKYRKKHKIG